MEEAAVHLVQRLLSLRETKGFESEACRAEDFRRRVSVVRRSAASDLVHESPQNLVLSSTSTTSLGSKAPAAYRTWCLTPHKPLFLRPEAPRLSGPMGLRRHGRGASPPASPYSFVRKHHVPRSGWADAGTDVVLHPPQTLVFSSGSTTSPGPDGPTPTLTWCFTPRNPLFLRRGAPRPRPRMGLEKEVRTNLPFDCTSFHFCSV